MKTSFFRRWVLLRRAGIAVLLAFCTGGCGTEEQSAGAPVEVRTVIAAQKNVPIIREWVGQTLGAVDIELRARVAGWLKGMYFTEGSEVKKGTLLYTIDTRELEQTAAEAKGKLAQARTLMVRAQYDVKRYRPLAEAGAVSQRDLDNAIAEYDARKGEVEAAEASLRLAEIDLGYARVTAPIDGLIGISAARVGDFVGRPPNPVILNTISRVDSIHVRFSITEIEYLDLMRWLKANQQQIQPRKKRVLDLILADGSVYQHTGTVSFFQRQIDPATGTLQFEASFPNPERQLRPGQFARIRTIFDERENAVVVPTIALIEMQGQYMLYTVDRENKVVLNRVVSGPEFAGNTVIEQGVSAGERVIVEGLQKVRPGMAVSPSDMPPDSLKQVEGS